MANRRNANDAINENNEVLLTREYRHELKAEDWRIPGGKIDPTDVDIMEAAKREFKEETGLNITVKEHIYTTDFFQISAFNKQHQIVSIYYFVETNELEKLNTSTKLFDFLPHQVATKTSCAEVFRWIDLKELTEDDVSLPIDKIVVKIIIDKFL